MNIQLLETSVIPTTIKKLSISGYWLNLEKDNERNISIINQLKSLHTYEQYQRIQGFIGESEEAQEKGLSTGEWGCWQGWLSLFQHAKNAGSEIVHLLEDDTDIHPSIYDFVNQEAVQRVIKNGAFLCTDGYINPYQASSIMESLKSKQLTLNTVNGLIYSGFSFPTMNSIFLTPATALMLFNELNAMAETHRPLAPIDITLSHCSPQFITTLPFLSAPLTTLSSCSSIHGTGKQKAPSNHIALTILRRCFLKTTEAESLQTDVVKLLKSQAEEGILKPY